MSNSQSDNNFIKTRNKLDSETREKFKFRGYRCKDDLELLLRDFREYYNHLEFDDNFSELVGQIIPVAESLKSRLEEILRRVGEMS